MAAIPKIIALGKRAAPVRLALLPACLFISLSFVSCDARFAFVGRWAGRRAMKGVPGARPDVMFTVNEVKLNIRSDGRFELQTMGVPERGIITIDGDKATLRVTDIAGSDITRQSQATQDAIAPIVLEGQKNGSVVFNDPKALDHSPVTLQRIATAPPDRP